MNDLAVDTSRFADDDPGVVMSFDDIGRLEMDSLRLFPKGEIEQGDGVNRV